MLRLAFTLCTYTSKYNLVVMNETNTIQVKGYMHMLRTQVMYKIH